MTTIKLNGWTKTILIIISIVGILVGWGIATGKLYSTVEAHGDCLEEIKTDTVPKAIKNEKDISNVRAEMEYVVEGLKYISKKQEKMSEDMNHKFEKQTELQMEILKRLPNE